MEGTLLRKVKPETLESFLSTICNVIDEIREAVPNKEEQFRDESYTACLMMNYNVIQALKWHELKKQEGKEIAG